MVHSPDGSPAQGSRERQPAEELLLLFLLRFSLPKCFCRGENHPAAQQPSTSTALRGLSQQCQRSLAAPLTNYHHLGLCLEPQPWPQRPPKGMSCPHPSGLPAEPSNKTQLLGSKELGPCRWQSSGLGSADMGFWREAVGVPIPKVTSAGRKTLQHVRNTQKHNRDTLPRVRDSDKFYPSAIAAAEAGLNAFEETRRCSGLSKTGAS